MNLELVTTDALFDELSRRFDKIILCANRKTRTDGSRSQTIYQYKGGAVHSLGMCEILKLYILEGMDMNDIPLEDI
jgi:hypothetical protein